MSRMCLERACQESCCRQNGHVFLACPAAPEGGAPTSPGGLPGAPICMPGGGGGAGKDCSMDWMRGGFKPADDEQRGT